MGKQVNIIKSLDWEVDTKGICLEGESSLIPKYQALYRSDNLDVLSVFKDSYNVFKNEEFVKITEQISKVSGFTIEGYQEVNNGKKVLSYLKNTDPNFRLVGEEVKDYIVIGNSHDGSTSLFLGNSTTILRCTNQFGRIVQNAKIRHSKSLSSKLDTILFDLDNYFRMVKESNRTLERFREIKIDKKLIEAVTKRVFDVDNLGDISPSKYTAFSESLNKEVGALGDNYWGLFNGITHYTTHKAVNRNATLGNLFGNSAFMNKEAYNFGHEYFV